MPERFTVEKVALRTESEGPDYFTWGEFQVTDTATGQVVARFPWTLDETFLISPNYSGPDDVRISDDGTAAIATTGGDEVRIALPTD